MDRTTRTRTVATSAAVALLTVLGPTTAASASTASCEALTEVREKVRNERARAALAGAAGRQECVTAPASQLLCESYDATYTVIDGSGSWTCEATYAEPYIETSDGVERAFIEACEAEGTPTSWEVSWITFQVDDVWLLQTLSAECLYGG